MGHFAKNKNSFLFSFKSLRNLVKLFAGSIIQIITSWTVRTVNIYQHK